MKRFLYPRHIDSWRAEPVALRATVFSPSLGTPGLLSVPGSVMRQGLAHNQGGPSVRALSAKTGHCADREAERRAARAPRGRITALRRATQCRGRQGPWFDRDLAGSIVRERSTRPSLTARSRDRWPVRGPAYTAGLCPTHHLMRAAIRVVVGIQAITSGGGVIASIGPGGRNSTGRPHRTFQLLIALPRREEHRYAESGKTARAD